MFYFKIFVLLKIQFVYSIKLCYYFKVYSSYIVHKVCFHLLSRLFYHFQYSTTHSVIHVTGPPEQVNYSLKSANKQMINIWVHQENLANVDKLTA